MGSLTALTRTLVPCASPCNSWHFDLSEDTDGLRSWSALASPAPAHSPALLAEVQALLAQLTQQLGAPGPVDDGHAWDMALDTEVTHERTTVSLHLTGGAALDECLSPWISP